MPMPTTALTLPNGSMMLEPKIVARMVQGLELGKDDRVLEIGTGSGYATALLATLGAASTATIWTKPSWMPPAACWKTRL